MSLNFSNRILTATYLSLILSLSLFINKYLWFSLLLVATLISFYEFNNLIKKIFKKKK